MPLPTGVEKISAGRYRGRYYGPDGRRHSTNLYKTPEQAAHARAAALSDIQRGRWLDPQRSGITLDQWMILWMPTRLHTGGRTVRPRTLYTDWNTYRLHIKPYLGNHHLPKLTRFTIETWHAQLATNGVSVSTIFKAHTLLKTALGRAVDDDRMMKNPCRQTQPRRPDRPEWTLLTKGQFEILLGECPEVWRPLLLTAAKTGLRWGEIVALTRADYNVLRREIHVTKGLVRVVGAGLVEAAPKSGKGRVVPVVDRLAAALDTHIAAAPMAPEERLFTSSRGTALHHDNFMHRIFRPAAVRAGLATLTETDNGKQHYAGVRFHDLRHSFISWLLNDGVDIHEVKELAGHASITTTELYAHTDRDELRSAMARALG